MRLVISEQKLRLDTTPKVDFFANESDCKPFTWPPDLSRVWPQTKAEQITDAIALLFARHGIDRSI